MEVIPVQLPTGTGRRITGAVAGACLALMLSFATWPANAAPAIQTPKDEVVRIQGILLSQPGRGPLLQTPQHIYQLEGQSAYLLRTLEDKRLLNRELRLVGTVQPDGSFQVRKIFTVRDGKLYRVQYYCNVCNIVAVEPGRCVCCQRPTKLQEIPVTSDNE
ncbi:MAG: hypothetical protein ACRD3T_09025 [Terriglobia bacterium]